MAGRVDQIELIALTVRRLIVETHGLRFDRNAAFALEFHRIEHLLLHLPIAEAAASLDQTVGKGRLAMVDMGDDGKVSNMRDVGFRSVLHGPALVSPRALASSAMSGPTLREDGMDARHPPNATGGEVRPHHAAQIVTTGLDPAVHDIDPTTCGEGNGMDGRSSPAMTKEEGLSTRTAACDCCKALIINDFHAQPAAIQSEPEMNMHLRIGSGGFG